MRRLALITLASLAALGGVAVALETLRAAAKKPSITLAVTPKKQTVARGAAVSFGVEPGGSSRRATRLRVRRLPEGVRARWRLADGRRTKRLHSEETSVVLTLRTSRRVRLGRHLVRVVAISGGTRIARRLRLTVVKPRSAGFSLRVGPGRRTISQGETTTYRVRIARRRGFRRRVRLRAMVRPRRAVADVEVRGRQLVVIGTEASPRSVLLVVRGRSGGKRRYALAALTLVKSEEFQIGGDLATTLYPGADVPLDLALTNPHPFGILVTGLDVEIKAETSEPECSGDENYAVRQFSGEYPFVLPPGSTDLSSLTSGDEELPHISMHSLPASQDACQGAELTLDYSGVATR